MFIFQCTFVPFFLNRERSLLYHLFFTLSTPFVNIFQFFSTKKLVTFLLLFYCQNITNYILFIYNCVFIFARYFYILLLFYSLVNTFFEFFLFFSFEQKPVTSIIHFLNKPLSNSDFLLALEYIILERLLWGIKVWILNIRK